MGVFDAAWLYATLRMGGPLVTTAMGEVVSQRSGVINIGLDGMMLTGAFFGFLTAFTTGSIPLGVCAGILAGAVMGAIMSLLSVQLGGDQIIVGLGILLLGIGLTTFLYQELLVGVVDARIERLRPYPLPVLSRLPVVGQVLFNQTVLIYLAYLTVPATWFLLARTRIGVIIRSAGESPAAVDANGVDVIAVRRWTAIGSGALAGFGGTLLSIGQVGLFVEHMTAGRGFLVLAAVFFGRWRPFMAAGGAVLFGASYALQLRLQALEAVPTEVWFVAALVVIAAAVRGGVRSNTWRARAGAVITVSACLAGLIWVISTSPQWVVPSEFWLMVPFVVSIGVLAGFVGRAEMPKTLALAYTRPR